MARKKSKELEREEQEVIDLVSRMDVVNNLNNNESFQLENVGENSSFVVPTESTSYSNFTSFADDLDLKRHNDSTVVNVEQEDNDNVVFDVPKDSKYDVTLANDAIDFTDKKEEQTELRTREDIVEHIAFENYNKFILDESKAVKTEIEKIKANHKGDYEDFVADLKNTDYYRECVEKWTKYYQGKKDEFVVRAESIADALEAEAKSEAMRIAPQHATVQPQATTVKPKRKIAQPEQNREETVVEVLPNNSTFSVSSEAEAKEDTSFPHKDRDVVAEIVETEADASLTEGKAKIVKSSAPFEAKYSVGMAGMKIDQGLRSTVEQIFLSNLYDSFDETRDKYSAEVTDLEASKRIPKEYKDMIEFRWQFAEALVQSFTKLFDITENKTVKNPFPKAYREVQTDLKTNQGNMDTGLVADMVVDKMYHYNTKTHEVSGIIPNIIDYLTIRIQEELLKNGQVDFNLYKDACKNMLEHILVGSNFAVNASKEMMTETKVDPRVELVAKIGDAIKRLQNDVKTGKITVSLEELVALNAEKNNIEKNGFKFGFDDKRNLDTELSNAISTRKRLPNLLKVVDDEKRSREIAEHLKLLKTSVIVIADTLRKVKATSKVEMTDSEQYKRKYTKATFAPDGKISTVLPREKGIRPIVDYLVMKVMEMVASENVTGKLKTFDMTDKTAQNLTEKLLGIMNKERNASVDFTVSLLENILDIEHDKRAQVMNDAAKRQKVQNAMDNTSKLISDLLVGSADKTLEENRKSIKDVLNEYIEVAGIKAYGTARKKVNIMEKTETK